MSKKQTQPNKKKVAAPSTSVSNTKPSVQPIDTEDKFLRALSFLAYAGIVLGITYVVLSAGYAACCRTDWAGIESTLLRAAAINTGLAGFVGRVVIKGRRLRYFFISMALALVLSLLWVLVYWVARSLFNAVNPEVFAYFTIATATLFGTITWKVMESKKAERSGL